MYTSSVSHQLQSSIDSIIKNGEPLVFDISMQIICGNNPNVKIEVLYIEQMVIERDFLNTFTDRFMLSFQISPKEYKQLLDNYQDLKTVLIFNKVNSTTLAKYKNKTPLILSMRMLLLDTPDLSQERNPVEYADTKASNYPTDSKTAARVIVNAQLVFPFIYDLNKIKLNSVFNNTKIPDIVNWCVAMLDIPSIDIFPIENTDSCKNMIIPPVKDISNIFDFLQKDYGLYSKGMGYYITFEKLLRMYRPYDTQQSHQKRTLHAYKAPKGNYAGSAVQFRVDNASKDVHVLTSSDVISRDLAPSGQEQLGNSLVILSGDKTIDKASTTTDQGTKLSDKSQSLIHLNNSRANVNKANNTNYVRTSNPLYELSKMASIDGRYIGYASVFTDLLDVTPCQKFSYHYDETGSFKTAQGCVHSCKHIIRKYPSRVMGDSYYVETQITAMVESEAK